MKKYYFIVVFARTPHLPSSLRRWCFGPIADVAILRNSASQRASHISRAFLAPSWPPTKLAPPGCFDAWDFLAKVHAVDMRAYDAALLTVCTFAACVIGIASTLLSLFDEPRARYHSCVLAAGRAPSTLR